MTNRVYDLIKETLTEHFDVPEKKRTTWWATRVTPSQVAGNRTADARQAFSDKVSATEDKLIRSLIDLQRLRLSVLGGYISHTGKLSLDEISEQRKDPSPPGDVHVEGIQTATQRDPPAS